MHYTRPVYYYEMDQMGIVHHANYLRYFEEARLEAMRRQGFGYEKLVAMGLACPVARLSCEYLQPARYPDVLDIRISLTEYDGVRFSFSYEVRREDSSELLCRAQTQHCLISSSGLPVRIRSRYPALHELLRKWLTDSENDPELPSS